MLVLTRKQKESIKIGDSITITILRVQGQAVRVGIEAPRDVRVVRGELSAKPEEVMETTVDLSPDAEPEVIQFRFTPAKEAMEQARAAGRGPLAALMGTLNTSGYMSEAVSK